MIIVPAILAENFEQIIEKLFFMEGLSERVQIDLCDGVFGLEKTWLPYHEEELPAGFSYEFDLMVINWRTYLQRVIGLSADRVVLHVDIFSDDDIDELLEIVQRSQRYLGLSISNETDIEVLTRHIKKIQQTYSKIFIQVMGISKIGAQGQPFDERVLARVRFLRQEFPQLEIQVDGAMNQETAQKVKSSGATCVVVGSHLFRQASTQEDVKKRFDQLQAAVN